MISKSGFSNEKKFYDFNREIIENSKILYNCQILVGKYAIGL